MQKIKKYYNKRITEVVSILEKPPYSFTKGTFHKLRVAIKKINAMFALVNFCSGDFKRSKTFSPFKKLFKQAGKIRDVQVERSILKKYFKNIPPAYKTTLRQKEENEKKIFFEFLQQAGSGLYRKTGESVLPYFKDVNKKKLAKYIKKQRGEINSELDKKPLTVKRIHAIRKMLKALLYISSIKQKRSQRVRQQIALSLMFGKWHDFQITIQHIKRILAHSKIPQAETFKLKKIISELNVQSVQLFNRITKVPLI